MKLLYFKPRRAAKLLRPAVIIGLFIACVGIWYLVIQGIIALNTRGVVV